MHWFCHYSIFPPLWFLPLSLRLRKECSNHFPFKREVEREIFSEGVELEDVLTGAERSVLTDGHTRDEKQSCSVNRWEIRLPIVTDFEMISD